MNSNIHIYTYLRNLYFVHQCSRTEGWMVGGVADVGYRTPQASSHGAPPNRWKTGRGDGEGTEGGGVVFLIER